MNEEQLKDAERYRWLRHGDNDERVMKAYSWENRWMLRNEDLDEKIDRLIEIDKQRGHWL